MLNTNSKENNFQRHSLKMFSNVNKLPIAFCFLCILIKFFPMFFHFLRIILPPSSGAFFCFLTSYGVVSKDCHASVNFGINFFGRVLVVLGEYLNHLMFSHFSYILNFSFFADFCELFQFHF